MSDAFIISVGKCDNETIMTDHGKFEWPQTKIGITVSIRCPHGPTGANATRLCGSNGKWDKPDITNNCANLMITTAFTDLAQVSRVVNCMYVSICPFFREMSLLIM